MNSNNICIFIYLATDNSTTEREKDIEFLECPFVPKWLLNFCCKSYSIWSLWGQLCKEFTIRHCTGKKTFWKLSLTPQIYENCMPFERKQSLQKQIQFTHKGEEKSPRKTLPASYFLKSGKNWFRLRISGSFRINAVSDLSAPSLWVLTN